MAFKAGAVVAEARLNDSPWTSSVNRLEKTNQSLTKSIFVAQLAVDAFKKVMSKSIEITKQSIKSAIQFQETNNKFKVVFKDVADEATKMRKNLVQNFGLSDKAAIELLSSTGDLLTGFGFTGEKALSLSNRVQELAVDLTSFQNIEGGAQRASEALTKALLGETESAKMLGIVIREDDVRTRLAAEGKDKLTGAALLQAKAEARLAIAIEQSQNAIGDYAETQFTLAGLQRKLEMRTEDISVALGTFFLPIVKDITAAMLEGANSFAEFLKNQATMETFADIMSRLMSGFEVAKALFTDLGKDIFPFFQESVSDIMESFNELFGDIKGNINVFDILGGALKVIGIGLKVVLKLVQTQIQLWIDWINVLKNAGQALFAVFQALTDPTKWGEAKKQLDEVQDSFSSMVTNVVGNAKDLVSEVTKEFKAFPDSAKDNSKKYEEIWNKSLEKNKAKWQDTNKDIKDESAETSATLENNSKKTAEKMLEGFKKFAKGFSFVASNVKGVFDSILGLVDQGLQQELDALKRQNEQKLEALEEEKTTRLELIQEDFETRMTDLEMQREAEIISQEEFDAQKTELENQKAAQTAATEKALDDKIAAQKKDAQAKENEREKKIFEAKKANQIANVWIQAAVGIVAAWAQSIAQLGPIAGAIFAGILTAAIVGVAIAETVVISQQKFIPAKEKGGMAGGLTRVHEAGGEIITLPDGSQVIPNDISQQIAGSSGGGGGTVINVSFAGAKIADDMSLRKITDHVVNAINKQVRLAQ